MMFKQILFRVGEVFRHLWEQKFLVLWWYITFFGCAIITCAVLTMPGSPWGDMVLMSLIAAAVIIGFSITSLCCIVAIVTITAVREEQKLQACIADATEQDEGILGSAYSRSDLCPQIIKWQDRAPILPMDDSVEDILDDFEKDMDILKKSVDATTRRSARIAGVVDSIESVQEFEEKQRRAGMRW